MNRTNTLNHRTWRTCHERHLRRTRAVSEERALRRVNMIDLSVVGVNSENEKPRHARLNRIDNSNACKLLRRVRDTCIILAVLGKARPLLSVVHDLTIYCVLKATVYAIFFTHG